MSVDHSLKKIGLPLLLMVLSIMSGTLLILPRPVLAAPTGSNFDHVVMIAMENQNYADVMGSGLGSMSAPFITSLLPFGSTVPLYHGYGANGRSISGCSAGCYTALISGSDQGISDGYSCCINSPTLMGSLQSAGLTWQAYCEAGCPRGNDHFPFTGFTGTSSSPNIFTSSSVSTSNYISAANSANPPSFLWYTPTDNHNMHDNSISTGDSYLKTFLVGSGTVASPSSGSLLASNVFKPGMRTLLILWWDEYDPAPILFYGTGVKTAYISPSNSYDEFSILRLLEDNWALSTLTSNDAAATGLTGDIMGATTLPPLSASFAYLPSTPTVGTAVTFTATATGGVPPYTYSWSGAAAGSGSTVTATFTTTGSYNATLTVRDSAANVFTTSQIFTVSAIISANTFDCTNWTCGNFLSPSTLSVASNGTAEIRHSNPSVCDWTSSYYDSLIRGTPPPAQGPSQGTALPSNITSVSVSIDFLSRSLGATCSGPSGPGPHYNLFMSLYFKLASTVSACGTYSGSSWLDSQVRVQDTGGVDAPVGTTTTYGGGSDPGVGACGYSIATLQLGPGGKGTLTASVAAQCANAETAWGIPLSNTCTLVGIEIGSEGYDFSIINTNWYNITLTIGTSGTSFTISATSPSGVNVGQSVISTITITALNGFAGIVTLADTVPSGLTCGSFSPSSVSGSGTATVSCTAANTGSYTLTIIGTSGSLSHSATTTFSFRDFTVSASSPAAVSTGSSGTSTITLNPLNGFSGTIAISDAIPSGLICGSVTPTSVTGSGTATLSCSSNSQGVYSVTITATSGSLTHQATAAFSFGTPPNFAVSATSPSAANVGSSAKSTITITLIHGLTGTVTLTISAPSGLNCGAISSTSFAANGTATVSCSSSSASTYTLTVTGMSGSLTHTATATFTFQDFSLSANPSSLSINTGGQGTSTISLNLLNGFGSIVALSVSSPTGVTGALSTATISGSGTSTLTISPTTVGSYTVVVTGTSGSLTRTRSLTISVGTQVSPILTAPSTETVVQTSTVTFAVTATDSSVPTSSLTLSANQLPLDSSFATIQGTSPVSGMFTWTPTTADAPGTYAVSFIVTNGVSSAQTYVIITLVSANVLPIITVPGRLNATAGTNLHFTVSATDPTGTGGAVILSATGLAPNMAFDPASGVFSFTPSSSQAGGIFTVNFTATDSNDPSRARTQSVPIHVMNSSAQPSGGGLCLSCLLPRSMTTSAWLLAIGALVGMISAIAILHLRASAEIATAKRRLMSMNTQNQISQTYNYRDRRRVAAQGSRRTIQDE